MSLHKITAGSGYDYLTRQVAVQDSTEKGHLGLASYYTQRGESPGVWLGSGMAGIDGLDAGDQVTAEQMQNLFGAGMHPLAQQRMDALHGPGLTEADYREVSRLGTPFKIFSPDVSPFRVEVAKRLAALNLLDGVPSRTAVVAEERARIRTEVGREFFRAEFGREPADARELAGLIAKLSRPQTTAIAGFDLTFSPVKSVSTLWALADPATAATIERCHQAAIADALRFIETHALFTRTGAKGVRQVNVRGLVAAAFTHRDSRAGDPDLHTHVAVANKVQTLTDAGCPSTAGSCSRRRSPPRRPTTPPSNGTWRRPRRPVRRPHHVGRTPPRPGDRRRRPRPERPLVGTPAQHRGPPRRARRGVPGRAWASADPDRDPRPGPAGQPRDPRPQARTPHPRRATHRVAGPSRTRPGWPGRHPPHDPHRPPPRSRTLAFRCSTTRGSPARRRPSSPRSRGRGRRGRPGTSAPKPNAGPAPPASPPPNWTPPSSGS